MTSVSQDPIMIDIPMPITTPRLLLRNVQVGDGATIFAAKKDSFASLHQWMSWAKELGTPEDDELFARQRHADFILRKDLTMVGFERSTGDFVMGCGLHHIDWEHRHFEIAYWVADSKAGKGYATEAANALTRFAFQALHARKVLLIYAGGNEKSKNVIDKLGYKFMGTLADDLFLPTGKPDCYHYNARFDLEGLPELDVRWGEQAARTDRVLAEKERFFDPQNLILMTTRTPVGTATDGHAYR